MVLVEAEDPEDLLKNPGDAAPEKSICRNKA